MKNKIKWLGIIAITAMIGIGMTGCGELSGTGDNSIVISGTLGGSSPSPNLKSRSSYNPSADVKRFSGTVQSDNTIQGILEDGAMLFKLTGVYDPETKAFSMQAASSMIVFALTGKLDASNAVVPSESTAVLHVKENDNWTTISLGNINPSKATVSGAVNQTDENITPEWARGIWFDQLTGLRITVSEKAISMTDGYLIVPFNILEIAIKTETQGSRSLELLTRAVLLDSEMDIEPINYTTRFYVAESWDAKLTSALGSVKLNEIFDFLGDDLGNKTLTEAQNMMVGAKMFIAPFCAQAGTGVIDIEDFEMGGYSPLFTADNAGTAAARNATELKAIPTFFMALQPSMNNYFVPAVGELTITGLGDYNGKYVTAQSNSGNVRLEACAEGFEGVKVQGDQVKLNVYTLVETGSNSYSIVGYEGSGTIDFIVYVSSSANTANAMGDIDIGKAKEVAFTSGIASAAFTPGPRITIKDLSAFEGKYVSAYAKIDDTIINAADGYYTNRGAKVTGGQAVLKVSAGDQGYDLVHELDGNGQPILNNGHPIMIEVPKDNPIYFDGNGEVKFEVTISSSADDPYSSEIETGSVTITLVDFTGTGTYKGPPTMIITGLAHNGKYVFARGRADDSDLVAMGGRNSQKGVQITSGQATLKVYEYSMYAPEDGQEQVPFNGTGLVTFEVFISATDSYFNIYEDAVEQGTVTVNLVNFEGTSPAAYKPPVKLTVTELSAYDGKYISGFAVGAYDPETGESDYIQAVAGTHFTGKHGLITNGTVTLNVYSNKGTLESGPLEFNFSIHHGSNPYANDEIIQGDSSSVTFTDGTGTCTFTARQY